MPDVFDPPLSREEYIALRQACAPVGVLTFLPADLLLVLSKLGYVDIVFGGAQISPLGLKRLARENERRVTL